MTPLPFVWPGTSDKEAAASAGGRARVLLPPAGLDAANCRGARRRLQERRALPPSSWRESTLSIAAAAWRSPETV